MQIYFYKKQSFTEVTYIMEFNFSPFLRFISKTTYFINNTVSAKDCRILYIIEGDGSFESHGENVKLCPGALVYYPYGNAYRIKSEADELLFYTLNFDFSQTYTNIPAMRPKRTPKHADTDVLRTVPEALNDTFSKLIYFKNAFWAEDDIDRLYSEYFNRTCGSGQICDAQLKILLINIYRKALKTDCGNPICEKTKNLICKNPQLNIKETADILGYHPFYLNEVFKKHEGIPLHKYLTRRRLIKACGLICTTELQLSEIALMCGFSSQSHFSTAFKVAYGISPGTLRRQT